MEYHLVNDIVKVPVISVSSVCHSFWHYPQFGSKMAVTFSGVTLRQDDVKE